jgi:hypothetical protein
MCRAMNRSILNVVFGGFGTGDALHERGPVDRRGARDQGRRARRALLAEAKSVVIVPGYGMAVARAQNAVNELTRTLRDRGVNVRFAIHPVAGRLPGHMNVLLAEAGVPYDIVLEMETSTRLRATDVVLVIGANDIVNPARSTTRLEPIYGMPVLEVWTPRHHPLFFHVVVSSAAMARATPASRTRSSPFRDLRARQRRRRSAAHALRRRGQEERRRAGHRGLPIVERYELDMDADARTDVAIGMTSGAVRVYRQGGSTMHELVPTTASLGFGDAIAAAGDVNGDGFGDLLIGDPRHVVGRTTGRASIYFGTRDAPTLGLTVVSSSVTVVGAAVAALGDLNGDGLGDFAVTEQGATDTLINVFLSPHRAPLVPAQSLSTMGLLNPTAMVAGDVSDDGRADIAIGFSGANGGAGAVLVYRASEAGSMMPYQSNPVSLRDLSGAAGRMGASLAMGSLINDRALELIVGAPGRTSGGTGGLLLYVNPFSRDSASLLTLPFGSPASSENFATSLSVIGDSDSDGATEFLILHPGKVSGSLRSAVLLTEFYPFGAVGGFNASVHTLLTGGTTPTYTRALSASGAFLDINNAGRQALVFTAEQVGGRTLQSSVLTGGGMGMDGTWTASNPTNVTMVFGFTNVIASR